MKDGHYFCQLEHPLPGLGPPDGKRQRDGDGQDHWAEALFKFAKQEPPLESAEAIVDKLQENHKEAWVLHYKKALEAAVSACARMCAFLTRVQQRLVGGRLSGAPAYPLSSFKPPFDEPLDLYMGENGVVDEQKRCIVLTGASLFLAGGVALVLAGVPGSGKTELCEAQGDRPLTVRPPPQACAHRCARFVLVALRICVTS